MVKQEKSSAGRHGAALSTHTPERPQKTKKKARDGLYIHPRGDDATPIKVSCSACISGHRSGDCNHFDRILLKIRAAGRPSQTCHHPPSRCGGSCLTSQAYTVPQASPVWCSTHRQCITNWENSDISPPYPGPAKQTKRKLASPEPALDTAKGVHGKVSDMPRAKDATTPTKPAGKSCCSMRKEPGIGKLPLRSHNAGGQDPATSVDYQALNRNDGFEGSSGRLPFYNIQQTPAVKHDADFVPFLDFPANYHDVQQPMMSGHDSHLGYVQPLPILDMGRMQSLSYESSAHARGDGPPPQKRPCPGNGYQCPCQDDQACTCELCFTHERGFWEGMTDQFAVMGTSEMILPPDSLNYGTPQPSDAMYQQSLLQEQPTFFNETQPGQALGVGVGVGFPPPPWVNGSNGGRSQQYEYQDDFDGASQGFNRLLHHRGPE